MTPLIKVNLRDICCFISFLLFFVIVFQNPGTIFPVKDKTKCNICSDNSSKSLDEEELICEKVKRNIIEKRKEEFTSRLKTSHNWVEEFLEIISENKTICEGISTTNTTNVKLLVIIVNSKTDNFRERQIIRESYGSMTEYNSGCVNWHVRTAFLVAQINVCDSRWVNETRWNETKVKEFKLQDEQRKYGDLVIGSFTDTYRNNTYKQLMGFKFILERCPQADLIVKTDDDVFVNIPVVLNKRMEEIKENKTVNQMYCPLFKKRKPDRLKVARYYVKVDEWPVDTYPDFCAGAFFVLSFQWMKMLYSVRNMGGFFWIDDTHVSGRLREIAEKEFGVKANILDINKQVWWEGLEESKVCVKVTPKNIWVKRKKLPMFAQLFRNKMLETNMKCLADISFGKK